MIKVILWLILTVGSLFSQEPQQWCFMPAELQKELAPSQSQCERIQLAYEAFWKEAEPIFEKLGPIQEQYENFLSGVGTAGLSKQQAEQKFVEVGIPYFQIQTALREVRDKQRRKVIEVFDFVQRQKLTDLAKQASVARLHRQAVDAGFIQSEADARSVMKGLAEERERRMMSGPLPLPALQ